MGRRCAGLLLLMFASTQISFDLRAMATVTQKSEADVIKFGDFIAQHYLPDIRVLADSYTYLPPSIANATYTDPQTQELLNRVAPELIIPDALGDESLVGKKPGTSFAERKFVADQRYAAATKAEAYMRELVAPSSGWSVVRENEFEVLLQRNRD